MVWAGRYLGWVWLDPMMGVVGAVVIAKWSVGLIRQSASVLLDQTDEPAARAIRNVLRLRATHR